MFHSLQLMQKKTVMLTMAKTMREVCGLVTKDSSDMVHMMLARLSMIMEYIVKQLYKPPASLLPLTLSCSSPTLSTSPLERRVSTI